MEQYRKEFAAYLLLTGKGTPTVDFQIKMITKAFEKKYGVAADGVLIGPIIVQGQTIVPENHVYIPIPQDQEPHKPQFTTGYTK